MQRSHHTPALCLALALFTLPLAAQRGGDFVQCVRLLHTLEGEAAGDLFGWVSSPVPDVTGDGVEDLWISAPGHDAGGNGAGRVYLYDGASGGEVFHVDGGAAGERLGYTVRDAGDLDGDGRADLLAGGPGSATTTGVVRAYSSATGLELFAFRTGVVNDSLGYSACGTGDLDLDGTPDVAVAAILDDGSALDAGRVLLVSGADGSTVLASYSGLAAGDNFGSALASLGDVTGDGFPELVVGALGAGTGGRVYVYDLVVGAALYELAPVASAAAFGQYFVASVGDVTGDGFPDLYVGDFGDAGGRGRAYVYDGPSGALHWTVRGAPGDGFGIGRAVDDQDGDGRPDLLLASWTSSDGAGAAGKAEVFSGADGSLLRRVTSTTAGEAFGFDAHGLSDADGDGVAELVVTAANYQGFRGRVYVVASRLVGSFGVGLAGSSALTPTLAFVGCPRPGNPITFRTASVLGGAPGFLVVGMTRADLPALGGTLYPDLGFLRFGHLAVGTTGVPGAGQANLTFALPADPTLTGEEFYVQAAYADAGAPQGVSFTPGLRLRID